MDRLYRRLWAALHRADEGDGLSHHERELLAHIGCGASLTWLTEHLLLPKSTASVLVKDLERRGYLLRRRDPDDERRLRITLTPLGLRAVEDDTVLDVDDLAAALAGLSAGQRRQLIQLMGRVAEAAERQMPPLSEDPGGRGSSAGRPSTPSRWSPDPEAGRPRSG